MHVKECDLLYMASHTPMKVCDPADVVHPVHFYAGERHLGLKAGSQEVVPNLNLAQVV